MRSKPARMAVAIASSGLPGLALAHPGHGLPGAGWSALHFLSEPLHGAGAALLLAGLALALWRRRRA